MLLAGSLNRGDTKAALHAIEDLAIEVCDGLEYFLGVAEMNDCTGAVQVNVDEADLAIPGKHTSKVVFSESVIEVDALYVNVDRAGRASARSDDGGVA